MLTRNSFKRVPILNFALVIGLQAFLMGLILFLYPERFTNVIYDPLFSIAPKKFFAGWLMVTGLTNVYGWWKSSLYLCRLGFVSFGTYYIMEAACWAIGAVHGDISWWPLIKDVSMFLLCSIGALSIFPYKGLK